MLNIRAKVSGLFKKAYDLVQSMIEKIETLPVQEHTRWRNFMIICGFRSCDVLAVSKYVRASGIKKQQLLIGKLHPAMIPYSLLDKLSRDLEPYLEERKPFKQNDNFIVYGLSDILSEKLLFEEHETAKKVRQLFGLNEG